jgi:P27 family predicted phage terminase small subunit
LKIIAGTDQPCRINKDEPQPKSDNIRPPRGLNRRTKTVFNHLLEQLLECRVATEIDAIALGMLATAIVEMNDIQASLEKTGVMVRGRHGYPVISPLFRAARQKQADVRSMLIEFGMTPSSRTRVSKAADSKAGDDWDF